MDQLQPVINKYNGVKGVGNTTANTGECVGLVEVWMHDVLKNPQVWGNAEDLLNNADRNYYDFVYNSPTAVPPRGAVLVFNDGFNGTVGHTGIVTRADVNTFELFEQNNPPGSGCRLHTYPNYNFVDGWIIPKNLIKAPDVVTQNYQLLYEQTKTEKDELQKKFDEVSVKYAQAQDRIVSLEKVVPSNPLHEEVLSNVVNQIKRLS